VKPLGGQPYDNHNRIYLGSSNDFLLNLKVERFTPSPTALAAVASHYETSGRLTMPMVTLHTTLDPIIPYWHEPLYTAKTILAGTFLQRTPIPVVNYGHCAFSGGDVLAAFAIIVFRDTGLNLSSLIQNTIAGSALSDFAAAAYTNGLP
jgi:hypothetical protein